MADVGDAGGRGRRGLRTRARQLAKRSIGGRRQRLTCRRPAGCGSRSCGRPPRARSTSTASSSSDAFETYADLAPGRAAAERRPGAGRAAGARRPARASEASAPLWIHNSTDAAGRRRGAVRLTDLTATTAAAGSRAAPPRFAPAALDVEPRHRAEVLLGSRSRRPPRPASTTGTCCRARCRRARSACAWRSSRDARRSTRRGDARAATPRDHGRRSSSCWRSATARRYLYALLRDYPGRGGKGMRPALLLATCRPTAARRARRSAPPSRSSCCTTRS